MTTATARPWQLFTVFAGRGEQAEVARALDSVAAACS
jgi:hypothetical protein